MRRTSPVRSQYKLQKRIVDGFWDLMVRVKYPKLLVMALVAVTAYYMFRFEKVQDFFHGLGDLGYVSAFIGGMLFAFGFGAPFGVAILLTIAGDMNIMLGGLIGGLGALASDYVLFKFIRMTFNDEILRFKSSWAYEKFDGLLLRKLPPRVATLLAMGVAGFVIASPLPDEIGVALLAGMATVKERVFAIVSFSLNTVGIFIVLSIGAAA